MQQAQHEGATSRRGDSAGESYPRDMGLLNRRLWSAPGGEVHSTFHSLTGMNWGRPSVSDRQQRDNRITEGNFHDAWERKVEVWQTLCLHDYLRRGVCRPSREYCSDSQATWFPRPFGAGCWTDRSAPQCFREFLEWEAPYERGAGKGTCSN